MRPRFRALWCFRPRFLTLAVFVVIGVLIVAANLSCETVVTEPYFFRAEYGWPFMWHWHGVVLWPSSQTFEFRIYEWSFTARRLAGNLALWLILLVVPSAACEWFSRRFRPRSRWSLRTLLVAVALASGCCAWFVRARDRADAEDAFIATNRMEALVEDRGPQWLDLFGADRFRRRIVGVDLSTAGGAEGDEKIERILHTLARLPNLQYLFFEVEHLTPGMGQAMADFRQLRALSIERVIYNYEKLDGHVPHEFLAAVGQMAELEQLRLAGVVLEGESLARLAGLTNLKRLNLEYCRVNGGSPSGSHLLSQMPPIPCLETIDLWGAQVVDDDIYNLSILPRLRSLSLLYTDVTRLGLKQLASLKSLEELSIGGEALFAADLESIGGIPALKRLHIESHNPVVPTATLDLDGEDWVWVSVGELEGCRGTLKALRKSHPGIVVDGETTVMQLPSEEMSPPECHALATAFDFDRFTVWLPLRGVSWLSPADRAKMGAAYAAP